MSNLSVKSSSIHRLPIQREPSLIVSTTPVQVDAEIVESGRVSERHGRLVLAARDIADQAAPGQFAMLSVGGPKGAGAILPRPMALYDWDAARGLVEFVYSVHGFGTRVLDSRRPGDALTLLGPLGTAFSLVPPTHHILVVGRGIGTCSLTALAKRAKHQNVDVSAIVSARTRALLIGTRFFGQHGATTYTVADEDGTSDVDNVEKVVREMYLEKSVDQIFVCGSNRLSRLAGRIGTEFGIPAQVSVEAHMACGIGYCHGCVYPTEHGEEYLVCTDGPVFSLGDSH